MKLTSGKTVRFQNYQNGVICPHLPTEEMNPRAPDRKGEILDCCRTRESQDYLSGSITSIDVMMEVGDIAVVLISFSGDSILPVVGEVEEEFDGQLTVYQLDGSILILRNPKKTRSEIPF